jgi:hypothetical protein
MAGGRMGLMNRAVVALVACLTLSWAAAVAASAAEPPAYLSSFGPDGTSSTGFAGAGPIAVDQGSDLVYVLDRSAGTLFKFDTDANPVDFGGSAPYISENRISGLSLAAGGGENQVAVDSNSHVVYVTGDTRKSLQAFQADGEPALFTAGPGAGTSKIEGFHELLGVAVDANGNIYASDYGVGGSGVITIYAPSGEPITSFAAAEPANLAVDSSGAVYVNRWHSSVSKFTPSEFPVTATTTYAAASQPVDPAPAFTVAVNPATNDVYIAENDEAFLVQIAWYDENGTLLSIFAGDGQEGEIDNSEGIGIDADTGKVYVANRSATDLSQVKIFGEEVFEPEAPTIGSVAATGVTADSATLRATINPNTLATTYRFEYGLGDCSVVPNPCTAIPLGGAPIGSGHELVNVSQPIAGLQANTTYHYRVVAENSLGAKASLDRTFTTQVRALGFELSDNRVWEMVSPAKKFAGVLRGSSAGVIQAAEDGQGLVYQSIGSIVAAPEGNRALEPAAILAHRNADGWDSRDITPPHTRATTVAAGTEYDVFSPNLERALLEPRDSTPLSPASSERAPYLRENSDPPVYTPLVTSKAGFANVPAGTVFGGDELHGQVSDVIVAGANRDLSHVVLTSEVPLVPNAAPGSLYEWAGGHLQPVSKLPADQGGGVVQGVLGSDQSSVRNAVSDDGSRVFWSPGNIGTGSINLSALYLRDTAAQETARLDVPQSGASELGDPRPAFQGASADGTVVFFTDTQQLTADASPSGRDLYRCVIPTGTGGSGCQSLTNLSAPLDGSGESAEMQGLAPAFSADGSRVYFVALGVLDETPNQRGEEAVSGEPNLYVWEAGEGTSFIATLSIEDDRDWGKVNGGTPGYTRTLSTASSPSGRYFAFMSERSLTGYESRTAESGELTEEIYVYDIVGERLSCVSCNPSGASPAGQAGAPAGVDPQGLWGGLWGSRSIAATLPEGTVSLGSQLTRYQAYRPRGVLDNGRVLFNAVDALVPADSNGTWDVYQYEPTGVGTCSGSSSGAAVSRSGDACLSLISSGSDERESFFLDASANGDDVFFITAARLSVLDTDNVNDVYDARVGGTAAVLHPVSECDGQACQPAGRPPQDPTPASESFFEQRRQRCPKAKRAVRRHGKVRCVPRKRHKHEKHHKRSGRDRRAHR